MHEGFGATFDDGAGVIEIHYWKHKQIFAAHVADVNDPAGSPGCIWTHGGNPDPDERGPTWATDLCSLLMNKDQDANTEELPKGGVALGKL